MSGSDGNGVVAGASTAGSGVAAVAVDGGSSAISVLGWIAIAVGAAVVISFLIAMYLKRKNKLEK